MKTLIIILLTFITAYTQTWKIQYYTDTRDPYLSGTVEATKNNDSALYDVSVIVDTLNVEIKLYSKSNNTPIGISGSTTQSYVLFLSDERGNQYVYTGKMSYDRIIIREDDILQIFKEHMYVNITLLNNNNKNAYKFSLPLHGFTNKYDILTLMTLKSKIQKLLKPGSPPSDNLNTK